MNGNTLAVAHSYYCEEMNYYANKADGGPFEFDSWAAFAEEHSDADIEWNMVFRWDWRRFDKEDHDAESMPSDQRDTLQLCVMHQRKGRYVSYLIRVTDADEEAVRTYLEPRWRYLQKLWEPLSQPCAAQGEKVAK